MYQSGQICSLEVMINMFKRGSYPQARSSCVFVGELFAVDNSEPKGIFTLAESKEHQVHLTYRAPPLTVAAS